MDNVTLAILAAVVLLSGVALAVWCERRYEIAIFMVALSPWISALFFPASANIDIDAEPEPALGSYI